MKLKLRGSESDEIEWNLKPFEVGHAFWIPKVKKFNIEKLNKKSLTIKVPHRLAPIVMDLTRFCSTGTKQINYGPGEVAIAIAPKLTIQMKFLNSEDIIIKGTKRDSIVKHIVLLFRKIIEKNFGVEISIKGELQLEHLGLGTSAVLFSGLSIGLNKLLGDMLTLQDLIKFVASNYCEEVRDSKDLIAPGFTTLGAFWSCINGGVSIVSGDFELAFNEKFPEKVNVLLGFPKLNKEEIIEITSEHSKKGFEMNVMDFVRHHDRFDASKTCYWVLMDLIPSIKRGDLKKAGEVIWSTNWNTIKSIPPILKHGSFEAFPLMTDLYSKGAEIVFLSSAGPSIAAISTKLKIEELTPIFKKYGYETLEVDIDNKGAEFSD